MLLPIVLNFFLAICLFLFSSFTEENKCIKYAFLNHLIYKIVLIICRNASR